MRVSKKEFFTKSFAPRVLLHQLTAVEVSGGPEMADAGRLQVLLTVDEQESEQLEKVRSLKFWCKLTAAGQLKSNSATAESAGAADEFMLCCQVRQLEISGVEGY